MATKKEIGDKKKTTAKSSQKKVEKVKVVSDKAAMPTEDKKEKKKIKTIGVLTSGGDAPGMNAAVRAVVRTAIANGIAVKGIKRGFSGLIDEDIVDLNSRSVADTIQKGGTFLFTARCPEMITTEGQDLAAANCTFQKYDLFAL